VVLAVSLFRTSGMKRGNPSFSGQHHWRPRCHTLFGGNVELHRWETAAWVLRCFGVVPIESASFLLFFVGQKKRVGSSFFFERGRREIGSLLCLVARVDDGTKLWRPGSMFQSDWTDPLKLFELIVSMSQSNR
jgi:hypothetical protein